MEKIKNRAFTVQFHRQVPMLDYILDFYSHEIGLVIEIDGRSHNNKFCYGARRQGQFWLKELNLSDLLIKKLTKI